MSNITYKFRAIPDEFLVDEFIDDPIMMRLIRWIFRRINHETKTIQLKSRGKFLTLEPYEFMFGRDKCAQEAGISPKQVQVRLDQLKTLGYAVRVVSKSVSTFSVYKLMTTQFEQISGQQNGQQNGQHFGQHSGHNQDTKKYRSKEDHHPYPSSQTPSIGDADPGLMTDDFFSKNDFQEQEPNAKPFTSFAVALPEKPRMQHNINPQTRQKKPVDIEVLTGVFLSQEDLDACIAIKGSLESVQHAIGYVLKSPGRKCKIYNWPNTLATWNIKTDIKPQMIENEEMAKRLEKEYGEYTQGWSCRIYNDKQKDQKGLLFEPQSAYLEPFFVALVDKDFKEKVSKFIRDKKMQKGRIS